MPSIALIPNTIALIAVLTSLYLAFSLRNFRRLRTAQETIELERRQLNAILSSMGEGMIVVDLKTTVLLMNQAAGAALRIAPIDSIGRTITDIFTLSINGVPRDFRADLTRFMETIDIIRAGVADDYAMTRRDSKTFPISMIVTPFFEQNKVIGAVILFHDSTREKEIDQAKDEFVSFASHQLRTPLGSMRWNMEMLLDGAFGQVSEDAKHIIADMLAANQFLIGLVNKLLDISRIEKGETKEHPVPTDTIALIKDVVLRLEGEAASRKVKLAVKIPKGKLPLVMVDPDQFTEAIANLISNAIKYNRPDGSVTIALVRDGNTELVSIADNGIGIPEEDRPRVFSKFYRASNASSGSVHGTGLGLFMVKLYIERSNGKIWFESQIDKGTTFYVSLPFAANQTLSPAGLKIAGTT